MTSKGEQAAAARRSQIAIRKSKRGRPKQYKPAKYDDPIGPAIITGMHSQDVVISTTAGAPKGWRRVDRLEYLATHGPVGTRLGVHQVKAGEKYAEDFQLSRIEAASRMTFGAGGGSAKSTLADSVLDAGTRFQKARAKIPPELHKLTDLFLCPEHYPFSLERCAAIVEIDRRAASYAIRLALSILARHYGFAM